MVSGLNVGSQMSKTADSSLSRDEIWLTLIYELCTSVHDLIHCYCREIDKIRGEKMRCAEE